MRRTDKGQIITLSCIAGLSAVSLATPAIVLATRQESNIISVELKNFYMSAAITDDINFALGKTYKLTFYWSDLLSIGATDSYGGWVLASVNKDDIYQMNTLKDETCKLYVNGVPKQLGVDFACAGHKIIMPTRPLGLSPESEIVLTFELDAITIPTGVIGILADFGKQ